ncbi:carboxypeptidase-like regulatory domain-containing protein [Plebeiibacterium marinum]|nr:carboxypeptidase-like regulatory domain-containing protein [Plebeiobacterium marinum]
MRSFLLIASIIFLFSPYGKAQNFNGTILDQYGSPIINASVTIYNNFNSSQKSRTSTDSNGAYSLSVAENSNPDILYAYATSDQLSYKLNFSFALKKESKLDITIYDLQGKEIEHIYSATCPEGIQNFTWDYSHLNNYLNQRIFLINFRSQNSGKTVKFAHFNTQRIDFYFEHLETEDFNSSNVANNTYTAVIEGEGFNTHTDRLIKPEDTEQNFIINKEYYIPFKCGKKYIEQYEGDTYTPFYIKGINLGAAIPGTSPAEMAPSSEQYAMWFSMMKQAGYNLIRVYTLHYPRFYQELKKFNEANPESPLYLMHGAWLDEEYEGFDGQANLFTSEIKFVRDVNISTEFETAPISEYFDNRIKEVIDVVHGNATLPERWGWASGKYTADVSPWILGYIMGREIYANEVYYTNLLNPDINSYEGEVFSLLHGTASEVWATERLDKAMTYEKDEYMQQHPISFSSWPTLDPIEHPTEHGPEDMVDIDLDKIDETHAPAGYFASYHVYPYFPDFMSCDPSYTDYTDYMGSNSYLGYLNDLKSQYTNRPLIISEYGVSSSWGTSRFSSNGMHHGGLTEQEQGNYIVRMMHNIKDSGCGGGILFSWIDEWFKFVWIFGETTHPSTRNRWHNIYNAEQNYGLITFIPEEADFSQFGYSSNDEKIDQIRVSSDIEGLYVKLKLKAKFESNDTIWVALDTYNKAKGESILPNNKRVRNRSEFCVSITKAEANLYVTKAYDMYGIGQEGFPASGQYFRSIATNGNGWNKVKWKNHRDINYCAGSEFDAGYLRIRDENNPKRSDAIIIKRNEIIVKLPWAMINFNDPSQLKVAHITDYRLHGGTNYNQTVESDGVAVTAFWGDCHVSTPRYLWDKWDSYSMPPTKEYKKSSYYIVKEALKNYPAYIKE